jgi:hypothetical protein
MGSDTGPYANLRPYTPNVEQIRAQASKVVRGRIPAQVRKELMAGVKLGHIGWLKKDGLKPEIFFHPDHLYGARDRQRKEAEYSIGLLKGVFASAEDTHEYRMATLPKITEAK